MHLTTAALIAALLSWTGCAPAAEAPVPQTAADPSRPGVLKLEELRGPQVDALDRERTLFILPIGMIEIHGPHLPIGNDTIGLVYEANEAAARLQQALPEWHIVMMPPVAYGQSGANELGGILVHPGTYGMRQSTLRSLVADLGGQVAQNRFKWVFVIERPRRPHAQYRHQPGVRLHQRDVRRDDAARHGAAAGRSGDTGHRTADPREALFS